VRNRYNPIWLENDIIPNPISAISNKDIWVENKYQQYQIIFVGRFDSVKGADVAILGFAKLLKTIPNARLIFAGPDHGIADGGRLVHIDKFARDVLSPDQYNQLEYLGLQSAEKIVELRQQSHVAIVPSKFENFAYTLLEGMASGMPVICSAVGGLVEIVEDQYNGLLFKVGSHDELAKKLVEILTDKEKANRLASAGLTSSVDKYGVDTIAKATAEFYSRCICQENQ
jgi:glycosyltransferase involved in cell wall biosynthesis